MKSRKKHKECALLNNMSVIEKMSFLKSVPMQSRKYLSKDILQLHENKNIGLLLDGIAILSQIDDDGEEILAKFISRNHIIDYASHDEQDDRYELEICHETTIVWFERDPFFDYARSNPGMFQYILQCESAERRFLDKYLAATSRSRAQDKVFELLKWFAHTYGSDTFAIPLPYRRLAEMVGLSRDRFKESMNALEEAGKIKVANTYQISLKPSKSKSKS